MQTKPPYWLVVVCMVWPCLFAPLFGRIRFEDQPQRPAEKTAFERSLEEWRPDKAKTEGEKELDFRGFHI